MGRYRVVLSVTLDVDADSDGEALDEAWDYWDQVCPDLECVSVTELEGE